MKILDSIILMSLIILSSFFIYFFHTCYQNFVMLEKEIHALQLNVQSIQTLQPDAINPIKQDDPCTMTSSSQAWEKLQKKLTNTVIQLLVTVQQHDILQPFKVPKQGSASGSAFIFTPEGDILTNAHVINGATSIMAQMTAFGKHQFELIFVGIMPEKDCALLKFKDEDIALIKEKLGSVPYLSLGDSDTVMRSQEILALGYPLGQQSLKSTTGVISGRESAMIQMSAPINPGSSGGPSINCLGQVIGINSSGVLSAQNVGYIIPINDIKIFIKDLRTGGLIRKPYIGIYQTMANVELLKSLGNPLPGGTYVVDVMTDSPLYKKLLPGDMIYAINGIPVDLYGEMSVPWSEDKVATAEYISRLTVGQKVHLLVYRKGKKLEFECIFDRKKLLPIREIFTEYEPLPYECLGGYVIMPLMLNHLPVLAPHMPRLAKYAEEKYQSKSLLIVTHVLPDSAAHRVRLPLVGSVIKKVNGIDVHTLHDLTKAVSKSKDVVSIETDDNILVALDTQKIKDMEPLLATKFGYHITSCMQELLK